MAFSVCGTTGTMIEVVTLRLKPTNIFNQQVPSTSSNDVQFDPPETTLFDGLDDWSLMEIFDSLDFGDLANMATLSPRYQQIIIDHYIIPKYALNRPIIHIFISKKMENTHVFYLPTDELRNSIKLTTGHNEMLSTLKAFCHLFAKVSIVTDYFLPTGQKLIHSVAHALNNHCLNVPQTVSMSIHMTDKRQMDFVFEHATRVELGAPERYNASEIARMFPRTEALTLRIDKPYCLDFNFPHLKYFELSEMHYGQFDLKSFGARNPQITGIKMGFPWEPKHLHEINEIFPNLHDLNVELRKRKEDSLVDKFSNFFGSLIGSSVKEIYFANVRSVTLVLTYLQYRKIRGEEHFDIIHNEWIRDNLTMIRFNQLESFKLITRSRAFVDEQIDLITRNKDLIAVEFSSIILTYAQMRRLVDALPRLKSVTLRCTRARTVDDIRSLLKETDLERITVKVDKRRRHMLLELGTLPEEWIVESSNKGLQTCLTFKRS